MSYILFWKIVPQSHGCIRLFAGSLDFLKLVYQANVLLALVHAVLKYKLHTSLWSSVLYFPFTFILIVEKNEITESRVFQPQVVLATVLLVTNRQMLHAATLLLDQTFELMVKII